MALDFQKKLAILDTLYLHLRHLERGPITGETGAWQSLKIRTNRDTSRWAPENAKCFGKAQEGGSLSKHNWEDCTALSNAG